MTDTTEFAAFRDDVRARLAVLEQLAGIATPPQPELLRWAPPPGWESYPVVHAKATTDPQVISGRGDARIVFPDSVIGPVRYAGWRNAVTIGGAIRAIPGSKIGTQDQRLLYAHDCGTVHVEGLLLDGSTPGASTDGLVANGPGMVFTAQAIRVEGLRGTQDGNHADVFQTWGGLDTVRLHALTGLTGYQGFKVQCVKGKRLVRLVISKANLTGLPGQKFLTWWDPADVTDIDAEVYVDGIEGRDFGKLCIWPPTSNRTAPAVVKDGIATWPALTKMRGRVIQGPPPGGDFVPAGSVGLGYVSPGYADPEPALAG